MTEKLALFGGPRVRQAPFPRHPIIGDEEKRAVLEVLESGRLSTFIAQAGEFFLGGEKIRQFEDEFAAYHGVAFAVAFNCATSALHAAVAACGVRPGEEVIVPPYTFTSTASCALMQNAFPVFADVRADTYCLDPAAVARRITPKTRAVIPVHLFGCPADMDRIMSLAREHGLRVIEDCAQAPGALYRGRPVGTIGDCGVFSFQETKNITTGEGGMLITDDEELAQIARMVRNHGEMVLENQTQRTYRADILGWGYRMTEMEAALGIAQLRKLDYLNRGRIELTDHLAAALKEMPGLTPTAVETDMRHVYYSFAINYDAAVTGIPRDRFREALFAEGIPCGAGYVRPLYYNPIYHQNRPFTYDSFGYRGDYGPGICPVAEWLHAAGLMMIPVCRPPTTTEDIDDISAALRKVLANQPALSG